MGTSVTMSFGDRNTTSSSSLRKIPQGNLGQDGDCDLRTRLAKFQRKMVGDYHGQFDEIYSPYKIRVKRIPPPIQTGRIKTDCLVGPEPDFSIRNSDLSMKDIGRVLGFLDRWNGKRSVFPSFIPFWDGKKANSREFAEYRPKAGHYRTRDMSDQQVLEWTEFAMRHGVRYKGSRSYNFSQATRKPSQLDTWLEQLLFTEKKGIGTVKCHYRSSDARQKRSAVRQKYRTLQPEVSISERRGLGSRRRDWKEYIKCSNYYSFKDYREKQTLNVCLQTYTGRYALSEPVIKALDKIYGHPIYYKEDKLLHIPTLKLVIPTPVIRTWTPLDNREARSAKYPDIISGESLREKRLPYRIDAGLYYNVVGGLSLIGSDLPHGRSGSVKEPSL